MAKERSGITIGLNRGHVRACSYSISIARANIFDPTQSAIKELTDFLQKTTAREIKPRISRTKGHLSKRTAFVREIVKEVSGWVFRTNSPVLLAMTSVGSFGNRIAIFTIFKGRLQWHCA